MSFGLLKHAICLGKSERLGVMNLFAIVMEKNVGCRFHYSVYNVIRKSGGVANSLSGVLHVIMSVTKKHGER